MEKPARQIEESVGCFSPEYELINDSGRWTEEDNAQVRKSKAECLKRYNKCLKKFFKVADKRYAVLCGL